MSIQYSVLGQPFADNAMYATVEPGQRIHRLLFDCGMNCLDGLRHSDIMAIDHLFFSHFHIDHIAGFDLFLRLNYARESKPVRIWGPEGAIDIIHHRLQGYTWDRVTDLPGEWIISEISGDTIRTVHMQTSEAFRKRHTLNEQAFDGTLLNTSDFSVQVKILEHRTPSLAYKISEPPQYRIVKKRLVDMGLTPGAWLEMVKDLSFGDTKPITINGDEYRLGQLRENLLFREEGDTLVYMTDCIFPTNSRESVLSFLEGCDTVVCESTYRTAHQSLAEKNYHLTAEQAASLARDAGIQQLILFHISDRYTESGLQPSLDEARKVFPETYLPNEWAESDG